MRRFRRDTAGGGEIAMMAVITKAMGAFLVIMILLLPFYTSDPIAQRTAEEATEQVEKAKQQIQEASDKLKKGRLTDEEIEELLKQLEEAQRQLEEALLNIKQLKLQVDQLTAQVERLKTEAEAQRQQIEAQRQEIAELKEEIERLKREIERLRRNQAPEAFFWNSVRLDWTGCAGARLNLYGASDRPDAQGRLNPPPDRTAQSPAFSHDKVYTDSSTITWVVDRLHVDEVVTFYVKILNALPDGPLECNLSLRWGHRPTEAERLQDTFQVKVSEKDPYIILVRLKGGERGSLSPAPVTQEERQEFRKQIAAAPCEGMACGLDDAAAKPLFVRAITERFIDRLVPRYVATERLLGPPTGPTERQRGEAVLTVLGELYVAKQQTFADITRWVTVLYEPMRGRGSGGVVSERMRELHTARLKESGAPEAVLEMFRYRVNTGHYDLRVATTTFDRVGIKKVEIRQNTPADEQAGTRLLEQWVKDGVEPLLGGVVARMVADGRVKAETAQALVGLIHEHRDKPAHPYMGAPGSIDMIRQLERLALRSGHPLHTALNPERSKVPPHLALPLVRQIEGF